MTMKLLFYIVLITGFALMQFEIERLQHKLAEEKQTVEWMRTNIDAQECQLGTVANGTDYNLYGCVLTPHYVKGAGNWGGAK